MKNGLFEEGRSLADISLRADKSADKIWSALMFLLFFGSKSSIYTQIQIHIFFLDAVQCNAPMHIRYMLVLFHADRYSLRPVYRLATIHFIYIYISLPLERAIQVLTIL